MENYKKADATTFLEIVCACPYCGAIKDVFDDVREFLHDGELSASNLDHEVTCSECKQVYIIDNIHY